MSNPNIKEQLVLCLIAGITIILVIVGCNTIGRDYIAKEINNKIGNIENNK